MNRLKEYRQKRHLSQNELAEKVGVIPRYIAFIEAGQRKPSLPVALKLAAALRASVEDIFLPPNCTFCTEEVKHGTVD